MNRPLRRVVWAMLVLFGLLIANITYVQYVDAGSLRNNAANHRILIDQYDHPRGNIVVDGRAVAASESTRDTLKYQRIYANGPLYAPATGFDSLVYGETGIESAQNGVLDGSDDRLAFNRIKDIFTGRNPHGGNVVLTLDAKTQQAAYKAMGDRRGSVVALDPKTGAILALVSTPSYNPNPLTTHDSQQIIASYKSLLHAEGNPLLNRAIAQTYPPGSVFKVIVSAAALESGIEPKDQIPAPTGYRLPQSTHVLHNFGGESCGNGKTDTLIDALTISCNTAFAQLGVKLGEKKVRDEAAKFGITDQGFTMPLRVAGSTVGDIPSAASLAISSIGQDSVSITPLQGAMIAAAVADGGELMKPYLVKQIQASNFSTVSTTDPTSLGSVMSSDNAGKLTEMMESVVEHGTGRPAQIPGVKVAAKTGTADNVPGQPPHAWFVGFAPAKNPEIAVAVIIEHGGVNGNETTGGLAAGPVAKDVIQAYLSGNH